MKIKTAHIALILSILALAVSLFTAVQAGRNDDEALIHALMAQNEQLQAQIDALAGGQFSDAPGQTATIPGANLSAAAWDDGTGADVALTLEGSADQEAVFRVMLDSTVIAEVPCTRDGAALTACAPVPANNGYTYSLIVGSEAKTLASPDHPAYPELVYLADSLSAYCNLVVGEWFIQDDMLHLETCYADLHAPLLSSGTEAYTQVRILLKHGDEILAEEAISPAETEEGGSSFTCEVTGLVFALPDLSEGGQVDLWLEATLSGGQVINHCAATWYAMPGGFSMAAG